MGATSPGSGGSQQSQGDKKDRISTLTPISISQVYSAEPCEQGFSLYNGEALGQVALIGIIREVEKKATKTAYTIEDHTGTVDITKWANDGDNEDAEAEARENMYIQVVGTIKEFNDKRTLSAIYVRPIDPNEITSHLLDTIHTFLRHTKGPINSEGKLGVATSAAPMQAQPMAGRAAGGNQQMAAGMNQYTNQQDATMDTGVEGGNDVQQAVINLVKQEDSDEGASVSSIATALRSKFNEAQIREALEWLSGEGHVYSTIDDDHFKSTDS